MVHVHDKRKFVLNQSKLNKTQTLETNPRAPLVIPTKVTIYDINDNPRPLIKLNTATTKRLAIACEEHQYYYLPYTHITRTNNHTIPIMHAPNANVIRNVKRKLTPFHCQILPQGKTLHATLTSQKPNIATWKFSKGHLHVSDSLHATKTGGNATLISIGIYLHTQLMYVNGLLILAHVKR